MNVLNETLRILQKQKQEYKNILKEVEEHIDEWVGYRDDIMDKYEKIIDEERRLLNELKGD